MGAWGEGLFENDGALDCLGDIVGDITEQIDDWFETGDDYSHTYEENIGPLVYVLDKICAQSPAYPPSPLKVRNWKLKFFEEYDTHASEEWGEDSAKVRRTLFNEVFDNLLNLSIEFHGENSDKTIYLEGTCLAIKLYIGGYGGAIVLKNVMKDDKVYTLISGLRGVHQLPPIMKEFEKRDWLYLTHHNFNNELHMNWVDPKDLSDNKENIVVVGQTTVRSTDPSANTDEVGIGHGGVGWIENQIWKQNEWDKDNA